MEQSAQQPEEPPYDYIAHCNLLDYRQDIDNPNNQLRVFRRTLMELGNAGDNALYITNELLANYMDNVNLSEDPGDRYLVLMRHKETGEYSLDYHSFDPVKRITFNRYKFFLDPTNYDLTQMLKTGRSREMTEAFLKRSSGINRRYRRAFQKVSQNVLQESGRGIAIMVAHSSDRGIERIPKRRGVSLVGELFRQNRQGARLWFNVQSNEVKPVDLDLSDFEAL